MKARQSVTHLDLAQLVEHSGNVRTSLGDLSPLARSIQEHGILQPLTVTEQDGRYVILAGHRRFAAGRLLGMKRFPVVIRHDVADPAEQMVVMLVENLQRRDLNPIEKAHAFRSLLNRGLTQAEISRRIGCNPSVVNYHLAFLELDEESIDLIRDGKVSLGEAHAAVIAMRQMRREEKGAPRRGRTIGTPTPRWFGFGHRLHGAVARRCDHEGRSKIGKAGCGECWEAEIIAEYLARAES